MSRETRHAHSRARKGGRGRVMLMLGLSVALVVLSAALFWTPTPSRSVVSEAAAPGRLVAVQQTVDLGQVPFDKVAEARFELDNTGGDIVRLVGAPKVRTLEGC